MHTLTLSENDHLIFQLYDSSTNPVKIKSRRRSVCILFLISLLASFYGYITGEKFLMYYGLFCAPLVLCFSHIYFKWRLKMHYTQQIRNTFNKQADHSFQIDFQTNNIKMIDKAVDSTVQICEIKEVNEIQSHYFLKYGNAQYLVIPKINAVLNADINTMINNHHIPSNIQLDWKW